MRTSSWLWRAMALRTRSSRSGDSALPLIVTVGEKLTTSGVEPSLAVGRRSTILAAAPSGRADTGDPRDNRCACLPPELRPTGVTVGGSVASAPKCIDPNRTALAYTLPIQ